MADDSATGIHDHGRTDHDRAADDHVFGCPDYGRTFHHGGHHCPCHDDNSLDDLNDSLFDWWASLWIRWCRLLRKLL